MPPATRRLAAVATVVATVAAGAVFVLHGQSTGRPADMQGAPVPGLPVPAPPVREIAGTRPPDAGPVVQGETSTIRGQVIDLGNGRPLPRAQIRARFSPGPTIYTAVSDGEGRFELTGLPAGAYLVSASRSGYVALSHGQRRPFDGNRLIELPAGSTETIAFRLPRGSVITGRVVDDLGEPVMGAGVRLMQSRYVDGQPALVPLVLPSLPGATTDDRGAFRLFGIPPGDYFVTAVPPPPPPGTASGLISYAPTHYPGTAFPEGAQRLTFVAGQEITGITIPLVPMPSLAVSGRVLDDAGRPIPGASVSLEQWLVTTDAITMSARRGDATGPDGAFTIGGATPGQYILRATVPRPDTGLPRTGTAQVAVAAADVADVTVIIGPPTFVRGLIVGPRGVLPPPGLQPSQVAVNFVPFPRSRDLFTSGQSGTRPRDDWTFALTDLTGTRYVEVVAPAGWALNRITHQGRDVTDTLLDFTRNSIDGLIVELTPDATHLSGTVSDGSTDLRDYVVVVFAEDAARWRAPTRFVRTARPDDGGRFTIRGLPPGRYRAVAVDDLVPGDEQNPAWLERTIQSGAATALSLGEGEARTVALRLWHGR